MKNDGTNFFKYAVAVAVACTKDERPKGDVTPEEACRDDHADARRDGTEESDFALHGESLLSFPTS